MSCTVRVARQADLAAATHLALKLVHQHHAYDSRRFAVFAEMDRGYAAFLAREARNPDAVILVATLDAIDTVEPAGGAVIGYAYGRVEERSYVALLEAHGALHDLYVDESARRRGVATALVTQMIERLRGLGAPRVVLSTAHANLDGQRLFAKLGFRPTMIEMTKELEPG